MADGPRPPSSASSGSAPAVVVGNHQSNLDIATYAAFFPDSTASIIGKKQIGLIPIFGWLLDARPATS